MIALIATFVKIQFNVTITLTREEFPMNETPPIWVQELVERVCSDMRLRRRPIIVWKSRKKIPKSLSNTKPPEELLHIGTYSYLRKDGGAGQVMSDWKTVEIYHGKLYVDQKLTVLHELAHWIVKDSHTKAFWDMAWILYTTYMPRSIDYALHAEARYKIESCHAAIRAGIPGAKEVLEWSREFAKNRK